MIYIPINTEYISPRILLGQEQKNVKSFKKLQIDLVMENSSFEENNE